MSSINKLSDEQEERLGILTEELGEVLQMIGKIQRFGFESTCPETGITNREKLATELGDALAAINLLTSGEDIDFSIMVAAKLRKPEKYKRYTYFQNDLLE